MTKWIKRILLFIVFIFLLKFFYSYSPYRLEYLDHSDKIWAHRNNSIAKANTSSKYFKGIELDLVYNEKENILDVNHPTTKSIDLDFFDYLKNLNNQPYLWLDIKNLTINNNELILNKLISIFSENDYLKSKVLIESRYPEAFPIFKKNGFKVIYYLPFNLHKMNAIDLNNNLNNIKSVLKKQPNIGISCNYLDYTIIQKHFPNQKKFIWLIDGLLNRKFKVANKVLKDENVEVVLISFKTTSHR